MIVLRRSPGYRGKLHIKKAEIQVSWIDQEISRFDVQMDDPVMMQVADDVGEVDGDVEKIQYGKRLLGDEIV